MGCGRDHGERRGHRRTETAHRRGVGQRPPPRRRAPGGDEPSADGRTPCRQTRRESREPGRRAQPRRNRSPDRQGPRVIRQAGARSVRCDAARAESHAGQKRGRAARCRRRHRHGLRELPPEVLVSREQAGRESERGSGKSPQAVMGWLRRWVILVHRWMGIALSLLFLMWFLSGIGMIYARGMPSLTPAVRLERMPALDFSRVRITPVQAVSRAGMRRAGGRLSLLTVMGRPAYRVSAGRGDNVTVFADSGDELAEIGDEESLDIASRFANLPRSSVHQVAVLEQADQWSIGERRQLPLHKFAVDDAAHTELYVSEVTAEVVLMTTRSGRALAWVAAIPHWMYFRALRLNDAVWARVVLWTSGLGIVSVFLGLVLSLTQMRTKYVGWMRWHYVTGAVFGVLTLTWVFSGWLSMDPIEYTERGSTGARIPQALGGAPNLERFLPLDAARWSQALAGRAVKEIELRGVPYYVLRGAGSPPLLMAADTLEIRREPFPVDSIMQRVAQGNPGVPVAA